MGVPKFFRYISERYPCLNKLVEEHQIPDFDNFYLDMNGIIHVCSHPDDKVVVNDEELIFKNIFDYVEMLFRIICPKKLFMMSVDGVAPRAKMNQQRGRRFKSAKEHEVMVSNQLKKGEVVPENQFDSNCITPGTEFMARLHEQFKHFISRKISTDELWQIPKIVYMGHNVPGEGEHKIMDYIRYLRAQPGYNPNTRHCIHGLDADFIMLGLCTHEPNFSLLREEVKFHSKRDRVGNPEETRFFLLHLSIFRDYLDLEFGSLKKTLLLTTAFDYDLERIIDDWVLLGFLAGNDFIPHLPHLHIANDALSSIYQIYIKVLPTLGGYINEHGVLNLSRFEAFLTRLSELDYENFKNISGDFQYLDEKKNKATFDNDVEFDTEFNMDQELAKMIRETDFELGDSDDSSEDDLLGVEFKEHKTNYYKEKLHRSEVTDEDILNFAKEYVRAIVWTLRYYYEGSSSWSWYYPMHYSPFLSDIKGFSTMDLVFNENDKPFLPFEQLMAVLPAASKKILPLALQNLMTSSDSPIIDFYPENFETDLNGKRNDWEALILIPFVNEESLLSAMKPCLKNLTEEEASRNAHGPLHIYEYTSENLGKYPSPGYFSNISHNHAKSSQVFLENIKLPRDRIVRGLLPGAGVTLAGFPTLKFIPFTAALENIRVRVFSIPSRYMTMVLHIDQPKDIYKASEVNLIEFEDTGENETKENKSMYEKNELTELNMDAIRAKATTLLGADVYVGWPLLNKAQVSMIACRTVVFELVDGVVTEKPRKNSEEKKFDCEVAEMKLQYKRTLGIELGRLDVLVYTKSFNGTKYVFSNDMAVEENVYSSQSKAYPYQTMVVEIPGMVEPSPQPVPLSQVFEMGRTVFLLGPVCYGGMGTVVEGGRKGRIKVELNEEEDLRWTEVLDLKQLEETMPYHSAQYAATKIGSDALFFSRITGGISIQSIKSESEENSGKRPIPIGLSMKSNKMNKELVGYTKKVNDKLWLYSERTVALVQEYYDKFPELLGKLQKPTSSDIYFKEDIFPDGDGNERLKQVTDWLKDHPFRKAHWRSIGAKNFDPIVISRMESILKMRTVQPKKKIVLHIKPDLLYRPKPQVSLVEPDANARHEVGDRIVYVRSSHGIPIGSKGTIIGNILKKLFENRREFRLYNRL